MILDLASKIKIPHEKAILLNVPLAFSFLLFYNKFIIKNILQAGIYVCYHGVGFIIIICRENVAKITHISTFQLEIALISCIV
jgi:hypothetical protein